MSAPTEIRRPPRAHCYRCDKPSELCLCPAIARVENQTPIVIVQHKRESRHPLGTVRIAELGLANCAVRVVPGGATSTSALPSWLPPGAGLLYPGRDARELGALPDEERPRALVLIDGTWHQARALFRDHAWLRALPRYRLTPSEPSRYRIRREPLPAYISTIEAVVQALAVLEPELVGARSLLAAFERLIDDQIARTRRQGREPRKRALRPLSQRALPRALVEHFDELLVVYGEAARPERAPDGATELLHWVAIRLRDGAVFDRVVRSASGPPSATRLQHLELAAECFADADDLPTLVQCWRGFVMPSDRIAAWNPRTLAMFGHCVGGAIDGIGLKGVYRRIRGVPGDLDEVLEREGKPQLPAYLRESLARIRGRARRRLENAVGIAWYLRRLALAP